jgi:serine/threonine protein kinase/Tol biopolymer transport system component
MPLASGTRIGPYEITGTLGAGGMGEVYRATDTKLKRQVAIKILPPSLAADHDRLARFQREAEVLASLNHPNIAALYGLEDSGGMTALVMELVEGEDLSQRIARGAIPVDEALPIATQIAEALEAAHEQWIVHRDLKPANIKVRLDGTVKVLDFGLAKAMEPAAAMSPGVSQAPTITTPAMTQAGMILGTAAYMSPEQARGKTLDKRTDIWAFGAVLFEMLTSARAFPDDDVSDVLASVLAREPDWARLPATLSLTLATYIRRCLHKDLRQRIHDIADVRLALEGSFETSAPPTTSSWRGGRLAWIAFAVAAVLAAALSIPALRHLREPPPYTLPETRLDVVTPATDSATSFALSPDGRQIVFAASGEGGSGLWLRSLTSTTAQPLTGTAGATFPFWSPDSRSVGFFAGNTLKRLDLEGGAPQTLAPALNGSGGAWNADGVIVFAPSRSSPLMRISATGGRAAPMTTLGPQQQSHMWPQMLPDGGGVLLYVAGPPETAGIYLSSLVGDAPTRLIATDSAGVYLPSGWLLWVRGGTLVAQRLDVVQAALVGETVTLADGVAVDDVGFRGAVTVAETGLVAYRTGAGSRRQLAWFDRSGTAAGTAGDSDGSSYLSPRVSPEGRRVAVSRTVAGNTDVWLLEGARASRVTFDAASDYFPLWSGDGTRIVFRSNRTNQGDLYEKLTNGASVEQQLVTSAEIKIPNSWSADGRFLLYASTDQTQPTGTDLWVLEMSGDRTPSVFLKTPFREGYSVFSPDGRWVAYHSNESGRQEIYVRPFIPPGGAAGASGGQRQVSTAGGIYPVWRPDGKEVFYVDPLSAMMAAPIAVTGSSLEPGTPVRLFPTRIYGGGVEAQQGRQYDVAPDGRFLINMELDTVAPITLLQNWQGNAKK